MSPGTFALQGTEILHDDMSGKNTAVCGLFVCESRSWKFSDRTEN